MEPRTPDNSTDLNRDPITGEPGSHPVGTGVGALGGAAAGAAIGTAAGPVGTLLGGAIGAVAGGLAGKGIAEKIDPTAEDAHWRANYVNEIYHDPSSDYNDYRPAYHTGYSAYSQNPDRTFDEAEPEMRQTWEKTKGQSRLTWEKARHASRAAWNKVEGALPGDSDGDGK